MHAAAAAAANSVLTQPGAAAIIASSRTSGGSARHGCCSTSSYRLYGGAALHGGRISSPAFSGSHRVRSRVARIRCAATNKAKTPAEEDWKIKRELLLQKRVRSVDVKEALRLQNENNFVILDVRPEAEFKEAHPPGAINAQIYRLIKEWTPWDIARRAAFLFFGIVSGTEENPEFMEIVESKLGKDAKIIVACSSGGTTKPSQSLPEGQQSRSLIAAYLLVLNGYSNVYHLEGGLYTWFKEGLPTVSEG